MNAGIAFILFGFMLLAMDIFYKISTRKSLTITGVVVGFKEFPTDKLITDDNISRRRPFTWIRIIEFTHPETGEKLRMLSNPGRRCPERIGTILKIDFNPDKVDVIKDYVWVHDGFALNRQLGTTSTLIGSVFAVLFWLMPTESPLFHLSSMVISFAVIWIHGIILIRRERSKHTPSV